MRHAKAILLVNLQKCYKHMPMKPLVGLGEKIGFNFNYYIFFLKSKLRGNLLD